MRRKCEDCNLVNFFTKSKKICDSCFNNRELEKIITKEKSILNKKEYYKNWISQNKSKMKEYHRNYYENNKELLSSKNREYYENNKELISIRNREYNKGIYKEKIKDRRDRDYLFKLKCNLRNLIKNSLVRQGYTKKSKTYEILKISYDEFILYIESKFQNGMSWDNYGKWHLDHIIPLSIAESEIELLKLNHYTNFQPLWAADNIKKSNKL